MSDLGGLREENERLRLELEEARQTIDAFKSGQVDAVALGIGDTPVLLRAAQETLRQSEQLFRGVFDGALDALLLLDPSKRILDVNSAGCELFGQPRSHLIGRDPADFYGHEFDAMAARDRLQKEGWLRGELKVLRPDGGERDVEFVSKADIRPGLSLAVMRDTTERKRLEAQLLQGQKLEAIGVLAGGIAHDFNNLLSVIISYTALTLEQMASDDPAYEDLAEVAKAGRRAADLTRQLLAFSRQQVLQPRVLHLGQVVAGMEKMIRRLIPENVRLALVTSPALGGVLADAGQIEQILMNLAVNARDAMPQGGHLTVEVSNVELGDGEAPAALDAEPGRYVMLAVTDTGSGIPPELRERIFEPFFTTKEKGKGTGLGLSTVFGIVKQSRGHLALQSEVGVGTTFRIYLPRTDRTADFNAASLAPAPVTLRGDETVLLVEDDEQVRILARTILRRAGYSVLEAQNGGEAFLVCEQHAGRIDLLLTDVVMPGIGGKQLAERVSRLHPEMKALFMSGYTDKSMIPQGVLEAGRGFLQKPITTELLLRKVREVLDVSHNGEAMQIHVSMP